MALKKIIQPFVYITSPQSLFQLWKDIVNALIIRYLLSLYNHIYVFELIILVAVLASFLLLCFYIKEKLCRVNFWMKIPFYIFYFG